MNKYITLENKIYEAKPVLMLQKVNDEILPTNRKSGSGADKNQFFIQSEFYDNLKTFFPKVIKDREEKETGRNKPVVKNYFDISSIANDISIINKEIEWVIAGDKHTSRRKRTVLKQIRAERSRNLI